jgi:ferredoxin
MVEQLEGELLQHAQAAVSNCPERPISVDD